MIQFEIEQDLTQEDERLTEALVASMTRHMNRAIQGREAGMISVRFVSEEEIQELNRTYRNKDEVTDVLSFSYRHDGSEEFISVFEGEMILGDVVVCAVQARRQAEERGVRHELVKLIIHGALHVLGYDHEVPEAAEEMFHLQDEVLNATFL